MKDREKNKRGRGRGKGKEEAKKKNTYKQTEREKERERKSESNRSGSQPALEARERAKGKCEREWKDRKSTSLKSSHLPRSGMPYSE